MSLAAKTLPLILALCLAPALAGAQDTPKHVDACALLSADEVSAITGLKVAPGRRSDSGVTNQGAYSSTCLWAAPLAEDEEPDSSLPLGGASFAILNVTTWPGGAADAKKYVQDFRDSAEANLIDHKPVELQVGDEAVWWGSGVAVRKNAVSFGISVHLTEGDKSAHRGMEETLARKIVAKL
jgi:hypothetical protein